MSRILPHNSGQPTQQEVLVNRILLRMRCRSNRPDAAAGSREPLLSGRHHVRLLST
ncbi:protein of unknown function [Burkholderia multivorans]